MSDELTPITRKETFLAKAGGQSVETPTPITREETFLQAIIDNGSGGGGGGGVLVVGMDMQTMALDKTWSEIKNAPFAVLQVLDGSIVQYNSIVSTGYGEDNYYVEFVSITGDGTVIIQFQTNYADGYPVINMG